MCADMRIIQNMHRQDYIYDQLEMARDRTILANESTLLSYVRTALGLVGAAIVIFKFATPDEAMFFGSLALATAFFIFVWGLHNHRAMKAKIMGATTSEVVTHRVKDLDIKYVHQGCKEKLPAYRQLIVQLALTPEQTAYVGDDVVDLPIMLQAGLAIAVQNAHPLVKQYAHWITPSIGGYGAAREACEMVLFAQQAYQKEMQRYLSDNAGPAAG